VPGDPDGAHEAIVAGPPQRLHRTAGCEGHLPLLRLDEVVELDQVDPVHAEARQRPLEAGPGALAGAVGGLGGEEEGARVGGQPRGQA
jgi:hypothetical protein